MFECFKEAVTTSWLIMFCFTALLIYKVFLVPRYDVAFCEVYNGKGEIDNPLKLVIGTIGHIFLYFPLGNC